MELNNNGSSIVMNLENLRQKYNNLLIQYKQSVADYMDFLKNETEKKSQFVKIKGQTYYGTGSAGNSDATTIDMCSADCAKNPMCTGATFTAGAEPSCLLRTGKSELVKSNGNTVAIVPKGAQLLLKVQSLNDALIQINKEYMNKIKTTAPIFAKESAYRKKQFSQLNNSYENLIAEKQKISALIDDHTTLEEQNTKEELVANSNYYVYILLILLTLAFIFILFKISIPNTPASPVASGFGSGYSFNNF